MKVHPLILNFFKGSLVVSLAAGLAAYKCEIGFLATVFFACAAIAAVVVCTNWVQKRFWHEPKDETVEVSTDSDRMLHAGDVDFEAFSFPVHPGNQGDFPHFHSAYPC